jgi:TatA/E family protein of Tat protein translocase
VAGRKAKKGKEMFNIGTQELLIILLVVLLLFGAKRIPEVARSLGKGLGDFRDAMSGVERELKGGLQNPPGPPRTPPVLAPPPASVRRETTSTPRPGTDGGAAPTDSSNDAADLQVGPEGPAAGKDAPQPPPAPPSSGLAG